MKIILISSVKLGDKSAAAITLGRHLHAEADIEVRQLPSGAGELFSFPLWEKFLTRLSRTRLARFIHDARIVLHLYLPLHWLLPPPGGGEQPTLVMTVAYGTGWLLARKYAARYSLPLVVRFDDWFPDCALVHRWVKKFLDHEFHRAHREAALSICISEGMRAELGGAERSVVILPIPEAERKTPPARAHEAPFRICYLGNLYDYGPMLGRLAEEAEKSSDLRFEFRGGDEANWPNDLKARMKSRGQLHGFLEGRGFQDWYENFDAYLVAMFFEKEQGRRVRTCFTTKLLDYASLGRPVIIWGPEDASVVRWARRTGAATCITNSDPRAVISAAKELSADPEKCRTLGRLIRHAYETEFSPQHLQKLFREAVQAAARR